MTTPDQQEGGQEQGKTGEDFHMKAEQTREEGKFDDALNYADQATVLYLAEGNVVKAAEAQSSRFLTLRHLWETTGTPSYKVLAQHAVESSVDMIRLTGQTNGLGIPLYNLAKWYETIEEYEKSKDSMKEALGAFEASPEDPMGSPSQVAEIKTRLAAAEYRLGDDSAIERFDAALTQLKANPNEDPYTQDVWVSGAHMHLAGALIDRGQKDGATEHINEALKIVGTDPRFILRQGQLQTLSARIA